MTAIVLSALLLAYPLSTGPVSRWQMGRRSQDYKPLPPALQSFYWPITKLCEVQLFGKMAYAYIWLWMPKEAIESYELQWPY